MRSFLILGLILFGCFISTALGQPKYNQSPEKDVGVDFVIVRNENVNLRGNANTSSAIIALIQKKERLILLSRNSENGFYLIGDLTRSVKGWIHSDFIEIWLTNSIQIKEVDKSSNIANLPSCNSTQNFSTNDPGMDMVKVNNEGLFLLSSNADVSFVLKKLSPKDNLLFISKTTDNKGYEVFDTETNQKGWVSCLETTVYLTKQKKQNLNFQENKSSTATEPPTLVIENQKNSELTFWVNSEKFTLAPLTSKSIKITNGTSSYLATYPKTTPISGIKNWENGVIYSLKLN